MKRKEFLKEFESLCVDVRDFLLWKSHRLRTTEPNVRRRSKLSSINIGFFHFPEEIFQYIATSVRTRMDNEYNDYYKRSEILYRQF